MHKYFTIYEEAVSHIYMTLHLISLNFLIYEENFLFFFISVATIKFYLPGGTGVMPEEELLLSSGM